MRLIMAESTDGFLALGPQDPMTWTGRTDKMLFRALTMTGKKPVVMAGKKTAASMPKLHDRTLVTLSRSKDPGTYSLVTANQLWPEAWLLGGPVLAVQALLEGFIDEAWIMKVHVMLAPRVVDGVRPIRSDDLYACLRDRFSDNCVIRYLDFDSVTAQVWKMKG